MRKICVTLHVCSWCNLPLSLSEYKKEFCKVLPTFESGWNPAVWPITIQMKPISSVDYEQSLLFLSLLTETREIWKWLCPNFSHLGAFMHLHFPHLIWRNRETAFILLQQYFHTVPLAFQNFTKQNLDFLSSFDFVTSGINTVVKGNKSKFKVFLRDHSWRLWGSLLWQDIYGQIVTKLNHFNLKVTLEGKKDVTFESVNEIIWCSHKFKRNLSDSTIERYFLFFCILQHETR